MDTTILLVDDHAMFRRGLRLLLEEEADMTVVGEAEDGRTALDRVRDLEPDVVVMDITMPDVNGIEATQRILSESPATRVIALSIHAENSFIENMLRAGAVGYCLKEGDPQELVSAIRAVMGGQVYLSARVTGIVVSEYVNVLARVSASAEGADRTAMAEETDPVPLRRTKLHRPQVISHLVPRPHLLQRLEAWQRRPLTLVCAPAGYGKTTLVATWLQGCDSPSAWLSLDEEDSDLRVFLEYALAAMRTVLADFGGEMQGLLKAPTLPPLPVLAQVLVNELDQIERNLILVLDDYQVIHGTEVSELLAELLRHPPRHLHLVLVSRVDPLLSLVRLRARSRVAEIRTPDLRFTEAEVAAYLRGVMNVAVDEATASALGERIEGWVTGLRLAALSVRSRGALDDLLAGMRGENRYVQEYLVSEVLARQRPAIRDYLLKTSVLDHFCAPLCEAMVASESGREAQMPSGREFMDWLERADLFYVPLDDQGQWARYHHLFQDLLRHRLADQQGPDEIASLHARASRWFSQNSLLDEALYHALAGGDIPYAVQLVEQHRYDLTNNEQWNRLDRWLQQLPPEIVDKNPKLLTTKAWSSLLYHSRWGASLKTPDQIEELLLKTIPESPERRRIAAEIDALRATQLYSAGEIDRAITTAERTLSALDPDAHSMRGQTVLALAMAYQARGKLDQALKIIHDMLDRYALSSDALSTKPLMGLCVIHWLEGNVAGMKEPALRLLKLSQARNLPESATFGRYFLGSLHYVRNELTEAESHFAAVVKDRYSARALYYAQCAFGQALCFTAWGRSDKARQAAESVVEYASETDSRWLVQIARAFQVELALRQERMGEAWHPVRSVFHDLFAVTYAFYLPQLTEVKVLLKHSTPASRQEAAALLDNLYRVVVSTHNTRVRIDVLALYALLHDAQGEEPAALEKLTESLALAQPGGFIRPFVDLGPEMAALLQKLATHGASGSLEPAMALYLNQILAAFPEPLEGHAAADLSPAEDVTGGLVEPLTRRELEALRLLVTTLSTDEIAAEMVISVATVRTYAKRIYGKLGVHRRIEAVQRAKELDLL